MKTLLAVTEDFIKVERTRLSADVSAGSNVSVSVENSQGFANTDFVVIGYEGNELAELEQINAAVSNNSAFQVATLKFNHKKGEPVTRYRFDKRKFYGAEVAGGSYTELTGDGSPVAIQVDDPQGTTLEYTDSTYEYFKATYYNSETEDETSLEEAEEVAGDQSLRYASLYAIRKHAGLAGNPLYSDLRIETKRKQAENEINSALAAKYVLPLTEIPPLISQVCELLAAGYIDYEEFGQEGEGKGWLSEGRAILKAIQKGTQLLIGEDGTELSRLTNGGKLSGYPDNEDDDEANFSMADRF